MSPGELFVLGVSHQQTPLAVRERLALPEVAAAALCAELRALPELRELVVLNTCNRVEFYGVAGTAETVQAVEQAFCARQHFAMEEFARFRHCLCGRPALVHLLEVASGLDSQMLGETEIFGQVKAAYAGARATGMVGPVLHRVFQKTFQAAKDVRTQTAITTGQVSVANVAVDLALDIFGSLEETRILLVGTGEIGEKTARAFSSRGAGALTVASRRLERATELATGLAATALPFAEVAIQLATFDIVVCCTSAPDTVVSAAAVAGAMKGRSARPLFLIDLALPRDVEEAAAKLPDVYLYNLDDLARIAEANSRARAAEVVKARALLEGKAATLWARLNPGS